MHHLGLYPDNVNFYLFYAGILLIPVLMIFYHNLGAGIKFLGNTIGVMYVFFILFSLFLFVMGLFKGNPITFWLIDSASYFVFICFIFIGTSRVFWDDLMIVGIPILIAAIIVNAITVTIFIPTYHVQETNTFELTSAARMARSILAYETQWALSLWSIFLLTAYKRKGFSFLWIIISVVLLFMLQILFQKRSPSVRIVFFIATFLFIIPLYLKSDSLKKLVKKRKRFLYAGIAVGVLLVANTLNVELIVNQFESLMDRLGGNAGNITGSYDKGFLGVFTSDNERLIEVFQMFEDFNMIDFFIGKSYGGFYREHFVFFVDKTTTHIGIFNIFLKGGLIYFITYFAIVLIPLLYHKFHKNSMLTIACFYYIILTTLFQLVEGWFYYASNAFECIVYAAAIGCLTSNVINHLNPKLKAA